MNNKEQRLEFRFIEDNFRIVFQSDALFAEEIIEHFVQFLQATGYRYESIYDAISTLALNYEALREEEENKQ